MELPSVLCSTTLLTLGTSWTVSIEPVSTVPFASDRKWKLVRFCIDLLTVGWWCVGAATSSSTYIRKFPTRTRLIWFTHRWGDTVVRFHRGGASHSTGPSCSDSSPTRMLPMTNSFKAATSSSRTVSAPASLILLPRQVVIDFICTSKHKSESSPLAIFSSHIEYQHWNYTEFK